MFDIGRGSGVGIGRVWHRKGFDIIEVNIGVYMCIYVCGFCIFPLIFGIIINDNISMISKSEDRAN